MSGNGMIIFSDGSYLTGYFLKGYVEGFVYMKYYSGDILIGQMEKSVLNGLNFIYIKNRRIWSLCSYMKGKFEKTIIEKEVENERGEIYH